MVHPVSSPRVTVLMPVFNGAAYLEQAITSILRQSFTDFELLIINDGSTDGSERIIRSFADPRLVCIEHSVNQGLVATLNEGLDRAGGAYVARMDCDDISLPERLEKQVAFLESHPRVGVCGTWYRELKGRSTSVMRCATDHDAINCGTLFNPVIGHPSVMLRKALLDAFSLRYDPAYPHAEDYKLWADCLAHCRFANIGEVLLHYRVHAGQVTQASMTGQMESAGRVRRALLSRLGLEPTTEEFQIHQTISALGRPYRNDFLATAPATRLEKIDQWLCRLKSANELTGIYPSGVFARVLVERWVGVCVLLYLCQGVVSMGMFRSPAIIRTTPGGREMAVRFVLAQARNRCADLLTMVRGSLAGQEKGLSCRSPH